MKKTKKFPRKEPLLRQLEQLERSKVRGGAPPPGVYQGNGHHHGWEDEPVIQPLYGVVIEE